MPTSRQKFKQQESNDIGPAAWLLQYCAVMCLVITPQWFSSHQDQSRYRCRLVTPSSESPPGTSEYLQQTASCIDARLRKQKTASSSRSSSSSSNSSSIALHHYFSTFSVKWNPLQHFWLHTEHMSFWTPEAWRAEIRGWRLRAGSWGS